jgi:5-oxoprolinase (ATP-hydrolysing) subunit C
MSKLHIVKAGMMVSVQDPGRKGMLHSGISASGPMDPAAFTFAQALVGNAPALAALEFAHLGGSYQVDAPTRIAITGGQVDIRIDNRQVPAWESHRLEPGETLTVGAMVGAVWGYVAFSGGIDVPAVLGSRSTHLRSRIGGLDGRTLQAGDALPLGSSTDAPCLRLALPIHRGRGPIRVVPGPQDDYFDDATWDMFLRSDFRVSSKRDRMATMLDGPGIKAFRGHDIVSDGTPLGSIQVPGSGQPIVLTAERQTTGGYPKIATIASVDLPRLAQTPSGASIRFARISQAAAEDLLVAERVRLKASLENLQPVDTVTP